MLTRSLLFSVVVALAATAFPAASHAADTGGAPPLAGATVPRVAADLHGWSVAALDADGVPREIFEAPLEEEVRTLVALDGDAAADAATADASVVVSYEVLSAPAGGTVSLDAIGADGARTAWHVGDPLASGPAGAPELAWRFDAPGDHVVRFTAHVGTETVTADIRVAVAAPTADPPVTAPPGSAESTAPDLGAAVGDPAPHPAADPERRPFALTTGHIDLFEVTFDAERGGLAVGVKEDTGLYGEGSQYRRAEEVAVWVDQELAALTIPDGLPPEYAFLGEAGDTVFHLPFSQDDRLPWPGWSTERLVGTLPAGVSLPGTADAVRLDVAVEGPGEVFTWMDNAVGVPVNRYIDTVDPAPDVIPISRNEHVHTAWAFTEPGEYLLTVTPSAVTADGARLTGQPAAYRIHVGPPDAPAPAAVAGPGVTGSGVVGEPLAVDPGSWLPRPHGLTFQWVRDGQPIAGATGTDYTPTEADLGRSISVLVTATVGAGSTSVAGAPIVITDGSGPGAPGHDDREPIPESELTDDRAGEVEVLGAEGGLAPGATVTVRLGSALAGTWVSVWLHGGPDWLGWKPVSASGAINATLPAGVPAGEHRLVVKSIDGELVGWDRFRVVVQPQLPPPPGVVPTAPASQCVGGATVLAAGHVDYATRVIDGRLQSLVGDDTGGAKVYREPSSVVLWLKPSSAVTLPAGFGQIGPPGSVVWQSPQTQNPSLVWLGWSTEALNAGNASSAVTWSLDAVSGPGAVKVYTTGSFGGVQMVFDGPGSRSIPLGVHAHANWAFTAPGIYRLTFTQSATLANGVHSSDTEVLTVAVGDVDPASAGRGTGCGAIAASVLDARDAAAADVIAATQASAESARERDAAGGDRDARPGAGLVAGTDPVVRTLWLVLGGVLLAGAAGAGVLWWRRAAGR